MNSFHNLRLTKNGESFYGIMMPSAEDAALESKCEFIEYNGSACLLTQYAWPLNLAGW